LSDCEKFKVQSWASK